MENIINIINPYIVYITIGIAMFSLIIFILLIVNLTKMKKLQKRYETFMAKDNMDLESLLIHYAKKVNEVEAKEENILKEINRIEHNLKYCAQKLGVVRYNAIENVGADLSFAIALLDAEDNGVVLNGIYSRDGSYIYSKPITAGTSTYRLSDEEIQAIDLAKQNNKAL